jgi:hypothetical protein
MSAALAAAMLVFGAAVFAATQEPMVAPTLPRPPLLPGEVLLKTGNGCGEVYAQFTPEEVQREKKAKYSGSCVAGLLHGTQTQQWVTGTGPASITAEFVYGREIAWTKNIAGDSFQRVWNYSLTGAVGYSTGVDLRNLANQDWSGLQNGMFWQIGDTDGAVFVIVVKAPCYNDRARYPRCTKDNYKPERDDVWTVLNTSISHGIKADNTQACPDRDEISSCGEVLARALSGVAGRFEKVKADSAAWKAQLEALYQNYFADYNRAQAAITAAAAARQRAAERQARRAEAEFQSSLKTMNAGQLFAKADEYRQAGDMDKARQTLRALVSRFPNSPLAATAAQQLSGMSASQVAGGSGTPSEPPGGGSGSSSREICRAQLAQDETTVRGDNVTVDAQGRHPGTLLSLQYAMYITQRRLNVLDRYCKGYPEYAMRPGVQQAYDTARTGCRGVSSLSDCPGPVAPPRR